MKAKKNIRSNFLHSSHSLSTGTVKHSINSFSSNCCFGFLFLSSSMSTLTCTNLKFVLQNPGSLNIIQLTFALPPLPEVLSSTTVPWYPVSSRSSRTAHTSGVSFGSISPAGTSMVILSIGGRYCFWRRMEGGELGFSRIAMMPTPSMSAFAGRVRRSPDSQVRSVPLGSL